MDWADEKAREIISHAIVSTREDRIAQALRDERERCAQIAERHRYDKQSRTILCYPRVAAAIRGTP